MNEETKKRIAAINSGVIPEGYKKTKVGIVPVEWEVVRFQDITSKTGKDKNNDEIDYPVYSINNKTGFSPQDDQFENNGYSNTSKDLYKVVYRNEFAYNPARINVGSIGLLKGQDAVIISSLYVCFKMNNKCDTTFFEQYFKSHRFNFDVNNYTEGSVREYLFYDNFSKIHTAFPSLPEQQKIAEILSTQDKLIELQEKKIDQLKELKKAYMQKMFPKKGSKYPELRFKGFTDAWEQQKLNSLCDLITVGIANSATHAYADDGIVMFRNQNIKENCLDDSDLIFINKDFESKYEKKRLKENDLLIARTGYPGTACVVPRKYEGSQTFTTLIARLKNGINPYYVCQYLNSDYGKEYFSSTQIGGGQKNSGAGILEKFPLKYPTNIDEQNALSDFFTNFDSIITLHQRKLEQEKEKKKALMQLLLTGKVRCI